MISHYLRYFGFLFAMIIVWQGEIASQSNLGKNDINRISMCVVKIKSSDGTGTGSIVEGSQYIFTNRHVLEGEYEFTISVLQDINRPAVPAYLAKLIAFSPDYDFAMLEIVSDIERNPIIIENELIVDSDGNPVFPVIDFGDDGNVVSRGDAIGIFGYPGIGESELVYTTGTVSSVRSDEVHGVELPVWYRTNADMAPGSSGGIAVNSDGVVIGMPTYVRWESETGGRLGSILSMPLIYNILTEGEMLDSWDGFVDPDITHLDYELNPNYGEITLGNSEEPVWYHKEMYAGGSEADASYLGDDCLGYVTQNPDIRVFWEGNVEQLVIAFVADSEPDDATLIVNTPDGSWLCNDDADEDTFDPLLVIENPEHGQYDIWLGNYDVPEEIGGQFIIMDFALIDNFEELLSRLISIDESALDYSATPTYGALHLSENFTPDPYLSTAISGGDINVNKISLGDDCVGFVSSPPDFSLHWTGSTNDLTIRFVPHNESEDTGLIINTPDGQWICNDDEHEDTLNPAIKLKGYGEGRYDIWISSYNENENIEGFLIITEL